MNEPYVYEPVEIDVVTAEELADIKKAALEAKTDDKPPPRIVSIDIETTGLDVNHCAMTEIALVDPETDESYHIYMHIEGRARWEAFSLRHTAVGRQEPDYDKPKYPEMIDHEISRWLAGHDYTPGETMALGWNVGSFDRQFIRRALPRLDGWLSYRHIDLTAIRHLLDDVNVPMDCTDHAEPGEHCENWAEHSKAMAKTALGSDNAHDALWDARAAALFYTEAKAVLSWLVQRQSI